MSDGQAGTRHSTHVAPQRLVRAKDRTTSRFVKVGTMEIDFETLPVDNYNLRGSNLFLMKESHLLIVSSGWSISISCWLFEHVFLVVLFFFLRNI